MISCACENPEYLWFICLLTFGPIFEWVSRILRKIKISRFIINIILASHAAFPLAAISLPSLGMTILVSFVLFVAMDRYWRCLNAIYLKAILIEVSLWWDASNFTPRPWASLLTLLCGSFSSSTSSTGITCIFSTRFPGDQTSLCWLWSFLWLSSKLFFFGSLFGWWEEARGRWRGWLFCHRMIRCIRRSRNVHLRLCVERVREIDWIKSWVCGRFLNF